MQELLAISAVTTAAFVSTNLDNLFVLIGFLAVPGRSALSVFGGYVGAILAILLVSLAGSVGADFAPGSYVSWLGVIPLGLGVRELVALFRGGESIAGEAPPRSAGAWVVGSVTLANGSDSLAVFVPLLAETEDPYTYVAVALGALLAVVWWGLAHWMVGHPTLGARLARIAPRILPFVLIAVGTYILLDTGTDTQRF